MQWSKEKCVFLAHNCLLKKYIIVVGGEETAWICKAFTFWHLLGFKCTVCCIYLDFYFSFWSLSFCIELSLFKNLAECLYMCQTGHRMGFISLSAFLEEDLATKNLCMYKVMTLYLVTGKHNTIFFCPCFGNPEIIIHWLPLLRLKFWDKSWWMAVAVVSQAQC